ncbi:hypothetical protein DYB38_004195 [Aphanomyces astaci]|uniref:Uncharacterized protein n=1 Tax=Aphanomyces astaci TaxID=112090 RepID=A0A397C5J0_APHAT|nr:hypothetical protein DYB38_004195 [Aphanomyces astaci]
MVVPGRLAMARWWLNVVEEPNFAPVAPFEVPFGTPTGTMGPGEVAYSRTIGGEAGSVEAASRVAGNEFKPKSRISATGEVKS